MANVLRGKMSIVFESLEKSKIVPLVQANDVPTALRIAEALLEGGLDVLEVVLRSENALACLEAIVQHFPKALIGAGTVLSVTQAQKVIDLGVDFIVCPGLEAGVVKTAQSHNMPILPGVTSATEMQNAYNLGLNAVKFFPASLSGGTKMISALSFVFSDMKIMPTGGINEGNVCEYLALPCVIACGGSWLTPTEAVQQGDFKRITELARQALTLIATR